MLAGEPAHPADHGRARSPGQAGQGPCKPRRPFPSQLPIWAWQQGRSTLILAHSWREPQRQGRTGTWQTSTSSHHRGDGERGASTRQTDPANERCGRHRPNGAGGGLAVAATLVISAHLSMVSTSTEETRSRSSLREQRRLSLSAADARHPDSARRPLVTKASSVTGVAASVALNPPP